MGVSRQIGEHRFQPGERLLGGPIWGAACVAAVLETAEEGLARDPTGDGTTRLAISHTIVGRIRSGAAFSVSIVAKPAWLVLASQ